ncbi:MAG: hypothetical protein IPI95_01885 [Flavobacteriales bacterium]|nr:hypothetical protein [Flavobacteriales bacterium]
MMVREGIVLLERCDIVGPRGLTGRQLERLVDEKRIEVAAPGGGGHPALYAWSSFPDDEREQVRHHLKGDPEDLAKAEVVAKHLRPDAVDEAYIDGFTASNGLKLPEEKRAALRSAAQVLALLATMDAVRNEGGPEAVQHHYGLPVLELKATILKYIKAHKLDLPKSFSRLETRKRAYLKAKAEGQPGASSLVHGNCGNANGSKLDEDKAKVLQVLCSRHQNYGLRTIARDYNTVAAKQEWPTITANTVKNFLNDGSNGRTATLYARGIKAYQNRHGMVIHRTRPSQPTYLWVHDGTDYEIYYQKEVGGKATYHHRKMVVVVVDPHSWYPIGFAVGEEDTIALSQAAFRNAVQHIRELTGEYALPYQVQSDRMGHKALGKWYDTMGIKYTPAAAKNPRSKIIEPWFRQHNDNYVRRELSWGGHNITSAPRNQPNTDALHSLRHQFPNEAEAIAKIAARINAERADKTDAFRAAIAAMPDKALRTTDRVKYLRLLGEEHPWKNELTNSGITPVLLGEKRLYNLMDVDFQNKVGTVFQVTFDPCDYSSILVQAREGQYEYLVPEVVPIPMALMDHTPETQAARGHAAVETNGEPGRHQQAADGPRQREAPRRRAARRRHVSRATKALRTSQERDAPHT